MNHEAHTRNLACPRCFGRGQVTDPTREPRDAAYQVRCPACYPREAKPTEPANPLIAWLHSPSLCPKGGCEICETVSDK